MDQALSGFRVIDFSHYIAGPYASMLLAELGAEVIKIERPRGDPYRKEPGFRVFNRSKKGIKLDLKTDEGQKIALELAEHADVVIESFRPGVAGRLGIGYDTVQKLNPKAVYCSISGFGQTGPYRDIPGWDPIVASYAGVYVEQGGGPGSRPLYLVLPLPSYYAAFMAAFSIATALLAREQTGKGQFVDISLFNAILAPQSTYLSDFEGKIRIPGADRNNQQGMMPLYKLYQGSDGKWFFLALGNPTFFTKFALAMGHDEWLIDPLFEGAPFLILPPRNTQLIAKFEKIFATKTRDEWIDFLQSEDIPCAAAASVGEFMTDPQVIANQMVVEIEDPVVGKIREMGVPVRLEKEPGKIKGPSPGIGEHTEGVLGDLLGYTREKIAELQKQGIC
jgi:crotonobetainyl-CoA:carnitine CoA-transferase CaiB-like acyl-CoA transferase